MSLPRFRRRRRVKLTVASVIGVLITLALALAERRGLFLYDGDDMGRYHQQSFLVLRAVDGDTLLLDTPDPKQQTSTTRIRLWGVDTPETAKPDRGLPAEPYADEAHDFTRTLTEGQVVTLALEPQRVRDKFGRILAYVRLPDRTWLNDRLITQGMGRVEDRYAHSRLELYDLMGLEARQRRRGLYERVTPEP